MPFKPGQSGNPNGRPKLDPEIKRMRNLTAEQFKEIANLILSGTQEDLQRLLDTPDTTMLTTWICKAAIQGAEKGDYRMLDELLNRLIGKVKDELHVTGKPYVVRLFSGDKLVMGVKGEEEG